MKYEDVKVKSEKQVEKENLKLEKMIKRFER